MFDKDQIKSIYRRRARRYDFTANLFRLLGFREQHYRQLTIEALALQPGATVVEIGCGTGLNFSLLQHAIGPTGKVVGVDMSPAMLGQARRRVEREGWGNVELIEQDAATYSFPQDIDGVLSTLAITLIPEFDRVIDAGYAALRPAGRMAILDFKMPNWPWPLVRAFEMLIRPYAASLDMASRHPWEAMEKCFTQVTITELYFGSTYLAVGEKTN